MKRMVLMSVVLVLGLFLAATAQAGRADDPTGSWSTPDQFTTKFWKEKFFGGGPGEPGNVLMAIGKGFVFQNAVLQEPGPVPADAVPDWCANDLGGVVAYVTTYEGGRLTLNPSGPWRQNFKAKGVKAINTSCHDEYGKFLGFRLEMDGQFQKVKKSTYSFDIQASFDVKPGNYAVKTDPDDGMVYQIGYKFDATITIY
jgi:hypothetical protein